MEKLRPWLAEFIGTFALIFVGVGAIKTAGHDVLGVALAHGLTIAAFVSATLHISGGNLNPAVTFGLLCGGHMTLATAIRYWSAQLLGGFIAALICLGLFGRDVVVTGTPQLAINLNAAQGILVEAILTFFLVFVVYGTAVDERGRSPGFAGFAIGATITLDILFGGPLTGAAMNPARVFGPALAANFWHDHYVYWLGPLIGGALGGLVYRVFMERKPAPSVS
ncbi:MAG TPA: MIP family channel protein [Chthoniobacterales bacterium]|jgi:aquaporin TIP|nr:MIP family channel protein [Chthoniobacterales bacterium]HXM74594.1 MIP family channel protein [Chthoniobacterales bacterium]